MDARGRRGAVLSRPGKETALPYPRIPDFRPLADRIVLEAQLKQERGARGLAAVLTGAQRDLNRALRTLRRLPDDPSLARREPNALEAIRALRPEGPRRLGTSVDRARYADRLRGALLGRMAGCTLGAPVEAWPIEKMQALAEENGDAFPPTDYWSYVPEPARKRYQVSRRDAYTRPLMCGVPADDDIAYTLLGLLILEEYGPDFTVDDVAAAWVKYVPFACTAEDAALKNLRGGLPAARAAERGNPYTNWIGGWIRADPWGYLAPGWPERAAEMAWRDAFLTHRRQGLHGTMFFAAAIAAAFAVDDPMTALEIGLTEIPRSCEFGRAVRWALRVAPRVKDYRDAREAVDRRFKGMSHVHAVNNACLVVFGLRLGGREFSRVIGETVAMGLDNDCTAATAGSLAGACLGSAAIAPRWHRPFRNTVHTYLTGKRRFTITGLLKRFTRQAALIAST